MSPIVAIIRLTQACAVRLFVSELILRESASCYSSQTRYIPELLLTRKFLHLLFLHLYLLLLSLNDL